MGVSEISVEEQVADVSESRPHIVILGAGASRACCPDGDRNGRRLPLMKDLVAELELGPVLQRHGIGTDEGNFEVIYSTLAQHPGHDDLRLLLEERVRSYFAALRLPDAPTLYDHLLLALRPKDVIATFNWDPLLPQAVRRNRRRASSPHVLFLHGNAGIGVCIEHRLKGDFGLRCPKCGQPLKPSKMLFPVENKDYASDTFIGAEWAKLDEMLRDARMLTVFGYSAPVTDAEAVKRFGDPWRNLPTRQFDHLEVIDIADREWLASKWSALAFQDHLLLRSDFDGSFAAIHPRRTCEVKREISSRGCFATENRIPRSAGFAELEKWLSPLLSAEPAGRAER